MSLFGWREKRDNDRLKRRVETLREERDKARTLAGIHQGNLVRMAQARAAQHDEVTRLRKEAADYGQMLTREVAEADEDVTAEASRAARLRLAWKSARRRALTGHAELATTRRLLATTQKQLDDATHTGDVGLLTVRPRPATKGQVTA